MSEKQAVLNSGENNNEIAGDASASADTTGEHTVSPISETKASHLDENENQKPEDLVSDHETTDHEDEDDLYAPPPPRKNRTTTAAHLVDDPVTTETQNQRCSDISDEDELESRAAEKRESPVDLLHHFASSQSQGQDFPEASEPLLDPQDLAIVSNNAVLEPTSDDNIEIIGSPPVSLQHSDDIGEYASSVDVKNFKTGLKDTITKSTSDNRSMFDDSKRESEQRSEGTINGVSVDAKQPHVQALDVSQALGRSVDTQDSETEEAGLGVTIVDEETVQEPQSAGAEDKPADKEASDSTVVEYDPSVVLVEDPATVDDLEPELISAFSDTSSDESSKFDESPPDSPQESRHDENDIPSTDKSQGAAVFPEIYSGRDEDDQPPAIIAQALTSTFDPIVANDGTEEPASIIGDVTSPNNDPLHHPARSVSPLEEYPQSFALPRFHTDPRIGLVTGMGWDGDSPIGDFETWWRKRRDPRKQVRLRLNSLREKKKEGSTKSKFAVGASKLRDEVTIRDLEEAELELQREAKLAQEAFAKFDAAYYSEPERIVRPKPVRPPKRPLRPIQEDPSLDDIPERPKTALGFRDKEESDFLSMFPAVPRHDKGTNADAGLSNTSSFVEHNEAGETAESYIAEEAPDNAHDAQEESHQFVGNNMYDQYLPNPFDSTIQNAVNPALYDQWQEEGQLVLGSQQALRDKEEERRAAETELLEIRSDFGEVLEMREVPLQEHDDVKKEAWKVAIPPTFTIVEYMTEAGPATGKLQTAEAKKKYVDAGLQTESEQRTEILQTAEERKHVDASIQTEDQPATETSQIVEAREFVDVGLQTDPLPPERSEEDTQLLNHMRRENEEYKEGLGSLQLVLAMRENENGELKQGLQSITEQLAGCENNIVDKTAEVEVRGKTIASLRDQLAQTMGSVVLSQEEKDQLVEHLDGIKKVMTEEILATKQEMAEDEAQTPAFLKSVSSVRRHSKGSFEIGEENQHPEVGKIKAELEEARAKVSELEGRIAAGDGALLSEELDQENETLTRCLDDQRKALKDREDENKLLNASLQNAWDKIKELEARGPPSAEEHTESSDQEIHLACQSQIGMLEAELKKTEEDISALCVALKGERKKGKAPLVDVPYIERGPLQNGNEKPGDSAEDMEILAMCNEKNEDRERSEHLRQQIAIRKIPTSGRQQSPPITTPWSGRVHAMVANVQAGLKIGLGHMRTKSTIKAERLLAVKEIKKRKKEQDLEIKWMKIEDKQKRAEWEKLWFTISGWTRPENSQTDTP
ncbi:hypothetical protein NA57DRAFT_60573 [Rhizodiscina lignyota]|uniref:Uncharacterized protein n=1 Tax=Rhizodiscina lignyota TaxID=1504668 RepID=A0A9P4M675_9PEZI|nr:hypothetical protein NA57DRAFT_60573 [Rhizodiscina lignyota]